MDNSFSRINGEYVKFYVTTNSSLPGLLKDTGGIVIYHDTASQVNYSYMAGQVIASGYGFPTRETLAAASYLAGAYTYICSYIGSSYAYVNGRMTSIYEGLNAAITSKLGANSDITSTYVMLEDMDGAMRRVGTPDLLTLARPAEYTDAYLYGHTRTACVWDGTSYMTYDLDASPVLAVGAELSYVSSYIHVTAYDSGALTHITCPFMHEDGATDMKTPSSVSFGVTAGPVQDVNCTINYGGNENSGFHIDEGDNVITYDMLAKIAGTPEGKYKPYPDLYAKRAIRLASTQDVITEHEETVPGTSVKGMHSVFWHKGTDAGQDLTKLTLAGSFGGRVLTGTDGDTYTCKVPVDAVDRYICVAVPDTFIPEKVTFTDPDGGVRDWTGFMTYSPSGLGNDRICIGPDRYTGYDFLELRSSKGLRTGGTLTVRMRRKSVPQTIYIEPSGTYPSYTAGMQRLLGSEDFASRYWLTPASPAGQDRIAELSARIEQALGPAVRRDHVSYAAVPGYTYFLGNDDAADVLTYALDDLNTRTVRLENTAASVTSLHETAGMAYDMAYYAYAASGVCATQDSLDALADRVDAYTASAEASVISLASRISYIENSGI